MSWIALKMLTGDRAKYYGIIFGITFAALLIAQQASIFCGLMNRTTSQITDTQGADIWVMDRDVQFIDDSLPLSESEVGRVRGVEGVEWAVRFYKGQSRARLPTGTYQQVILLGVDDATLVGAPQEMIHGSLADLRQPDAVIVDRAGWEIMFPGQPFKAGTELEMNDRRAVIVGMCKASATFQSFPICYTRYNQATLFVPRERKVLTFILAQPKPGYDIHDVCRRIEEQTAGKLKAMPRDEFEWTTIWYFMEKTGIPINFGITVLLGFIVGSAIVGQTFYMFTMENLKHFGALKAMGVSNARIVGMSMLQALVVGFIGFGLGIGLAALFGELNKGADTLAFYMPWQVVVLTAASVFLIVTLSSLISIRRVLTVEPAIVFRQ
jgi:putative ABC transport system permease protein